MEALFNTGIGIIVGIVGFVLLYYIEALLKIDAEVDAMHAAVSLLGWQLVVLGGAYAATQSMHGPVGVLIVFIMFMLLSFWLNSPDGKEFMNKVEERAKKKEHD